MEVYEISDYDSETCESSDDETEGTDDVLNFCQRITEELQVCFRRNFGTDEDYCSDIYEDKFAAAGSGSYSYYADILAVAQLKDKAGGDTSLKTNSDCTQTSVTESNKIYPNHWKCSGQRNPKAGAGPFEDLFQVLGNPPGAEGVANVNATPLVYPPEWTGNTCLQNTYDEELIGIGPIDGDYSSFIDVFHRWNNDPFTTLPSTNNNDFISPDFHSF